jgi:hypothetical protein
VILIVIHHSLNPLGSNYSNSRWELPATFALNIVGGNTSSKEIFILAFID